MTDRRGQPWTNEEYAELETLFDQDRDLLGICKALGRTPSAVIGKLQGLGRLTNQGHGYHKVDPDPWLLWQSVVELDKEFKESLGNHDG